MARNMVLTYLHELDPEDLPLILGVLLERMSEVFFPEIRFLGLLYRMVPLSDVCWFINLIN